MIQFEQALKNIDSEITLGILQAEVEVMPTTEVFKVLMQDLEVEIRQTFTLENYKGPRLEAARRIYRTLGKDPSRYRISSDALLRRLIKGRGLYYVNNVVDINNVISLRTQWSVGAYDLSKIHGAISYGVGQADEVYEGIGRGLLNIENLPVLRDDLGSFGSATSDTLRTMVTKETTQLLMVIHGFGCEKGMDEAMALMQSYLKSQANGQNFSTYIVKNR